MATKKELIAFRLKPSNILKLKEIAEKKDITISELVRKVVENYLETAI